MRLRNLFLFVILLPAWNFTAAQSPQLSSEASVSLLTCGPGPEVFTYFGHSALRVTDPEIHLDRVYNYGTFDFNIPNFYGQFIKGKCYYMLSIVRFQGFAPEYIEENRFIKERELNITLPEKQKLFDLLEINYLPENRHYWYDFFMDNCSTRIRDIVIKATGNNYIWPPEPATHLTYRQLIMPYISLNTWARTGILLTLAGGADREATQQGYMFLPDHMHRLFAEARLTDGSPLCKPEVVLFEPEYPKPIGTGLVHPYFIFSLLVVASWFIALFRKMPARLVNSFYTFLFVLSGGLGLVFTYMWLFSSFTVCHANLNLAWAFPLNIILALTLWFPRAHTFNRIYGRLMSGVAILFLLTFIFWKQSIPVEGILFCLALLPGLLIQSGLKVFRNAKSKDEAN
ncbi:MAG: DUF4105 domain-containing protein [Bacteroidales bacterium]|jgi:hypothetical protein